MNFLQFLAQYRSPAGDVFFQLITFLAQELLVVAIICWLFWCSDKRLAYALGFSYFFSGFLVQGMKITFRVPRPWLLDPEFSPVASAVPGATGYSFPSGHTQSITSLLGTAGLHARRSARKFLCAAGIAAVGFSRMYLGCHTPADVLCAFALTALITLLTYRFFYIKDTAAQKPGAVSALLAFLSVLLAVYALTLNRGDIISADNTQDCIKAAAAGLAFAIGFYAESRYIRFSPPAARTGRIIRFLCGLFTALLLLELPKYLWGTALLCSFLRYFLTVLWILVLYPLCFSRLGNRVFHKTK